MSGTGTWNPPASPTIGQLYSFANQIWQWNGTQWMNANIGANINSMVPQNYVDNSGFTVNQRAYASGTALPAGAAGNVGYGFDRWKAGSAGATLTFTPTPASTIVNITAGAIQQIIEGLNLLTGEYTLSWTGTATGGLPGSPGASPQHINATAGQNLTIQFQGGTLGQVQLQLGSVATPWQPQPAAVELERCQRFFASMLLLFSMYQQAGAGVAWQMTYPTTMRAAPTVSTVGGVAWVLNNISNFSLVVGPSQLNTPFSVTATATGPCSMNNNVYLSADF